jgi:hypothetical protein
MAKEAAMVTTEDLVSVSGLCNEIIKRVGNGSLEPRDITRALQELIDGRMPWHNRFAPYNGILLDLSDQKQRLLELDRIYWSGRFANQITLLDTSGSYDQRVDAVRVFHVAGRTPQDTINNIWWPVIRGTWPNAYRWEELKTDPDHLDQTPNTRRYAPGVHLIRLNLVAHWDPERPHTTEEVRTRASENGELLAHGEVLSAYGLHTHLLGMLDGKNLPYADMAGYRAKVSPAGAWQYAPCLMKGQLTGPQLTGHLITDRRLSAVPTVSAA